MKFKTVTCLTITILGFVSFASANPPQDNNGFVPIFDGKTLDGWHNVPESKAGDWSVIDGKIVGQGSENRLTYLVWKDELTDFELKFRYRMVGKGNTGVEIRAQPDPSGRRPFVGYHADFGHVGIGANVLGAWDFHFAGRREYPCPRGTRLMIDRDGKTKSETIANALTVEDVRKQQWNDVQVIAHGNRFQFFINGKPASEFTDNIEKGRLQKGVIGLQIHDKGMRVEFKDILLKRIPATVDIGTRRELFVDDLLIGKLQGTRLKMHQPQKLRHLPPRPFGHYATVLKDGKKLRLYYRGDKVPGAHWRNGWGKYHEGEVTLYAESTDGGIHWTEPKLNQFKIPEMPKGNVVLAVTDDTFLVTHNFTPFIDTRPGVPKDQRYKALGGGRYPPENWGGWKIKDERKNLRKKYGPGGLKAFASADGLNWKLLKKEPVIQEDLGSFDSQNVAFWSEAEGQYVAYFRFFKNGVRSIRRSTSKDFLHWTEPVDMIANEPGEHLYTSVTQPYFRAPHIYIALPTRFQARAGAITDIVFMATRPGSNKYHRHFKEAFIRPGLGARGWGNRANYITLNVVPTSPTHMSMFMYGGGHYLLRYDGFISIHADYQPGEFLTKPLKFSGKVPELNYSTSGAGKIRVEIQDADGKPIPGFSLKDCEPLQGDTISGFVKWKGKTDVADLAGQTVRLRFVMNEADLYSLRFPEVAPKE